MNNIHYFFRKLFGLRKYISVFVDRFGWSGHRVTKYNIDNFSLMTRNDNRRINDIISRREREKKKKKRHVKASKLCTEWPRSYEVAGRQAPFSTRKLSSIDRAWVSCLFIVVYKPIYTALPGRERVIDKVIANFCWLIFF